MIGQARRLVLVVAVLPCVWGIGSAAQSADTGVRFEVASIKRNTDGHFGSGPPVSPNGDVRLINVPVKALIARAYPIDTAPADIIGAPSWTDSERYDVIAKEKPDATRDEQQQMWLALLADRMKLAAHYEAREKPSYDLVVARKDGRLGPGLKPSTLDCTQPPAAAPPSPEALRDMKAFGLSRGRTLTTDPKDGTTYAGGLTMQVLAQMLAGAAGRPIVDKTGLDGYYTVIVRYQRRPQRADAQPSPDDPPSVFTALEEQLGLKLESSKAQVKVLMIDHIERPDPD